MGRKPTDVFTALICCAIIAMGTWAHQHGLIGDQLYYLATAVLFIAVVFMASEEAIAGLLAGGQS
jgi:hypothetical protein